MSRQGISHRRATAGTVGRNETIKTRPTKPLPNNPVSTQGLGRLVRSSELFSIFSPDEDLWIEKAFIACQANGVPYSECMKVVAEDLKKPYSAVMSRVDYLGLLIFLNAGRASGELRAKEVFSFEPDDSTDKLIWQLYCSYNNPTSNALAALTNNGVAAFNAPPGQVMALASVLKTNSRALCMRLALLRKQYQEHRAEALRAMVTIKSTSSVQYTTNIAAHSSQKTGYTDGTAETQSAPAPPSLARSEQSPALSFNTKQTVQSTRSKQVASCRDSWAQRGSQQPLQSLPSPLPDYCLAASSPSDNPQCTRRGNAAFTEQDDNVLWSAYLAENGPDLPPPRRCTVRWTPPAGFVSGLAERLHRPPNSIVNRMKHLFVQYQWSRGRFRGNAAPVEKEEAEKRRSIPGLGSESSVCPSVGDISIPSRLDDEEPFATSASACALPPTVPDAPPLLLSRRCKRKAAELADKLAAAAPTLLLLEADDDSSDFRGPAAPPEASTTGEPGIGERELRRRTGYHRYTPQDDATIWAAYQELLRLQHEPGNTETWIKRAQGVAEQLGRSKESVRYRLRVLLDQQAASEKLSCPSAAQDCLPGAPLTKLEDSNAEDSAAKDVLGRFLAYEQPPYSPQPMICARRATHPLEESSNNKLVFTIRCATAIAPSFNIADCSSKEGFSPELASSPVGSACIRLFHAEDLCSDCSGGAEGDKGSKEETKDDGELTDDDDVSALSFSSISAAETEEKSTSPAAVSCHHCEGRSLVDSLKDGEEGKQELDEAALHAAGHRMPLDGVLFTPEEDALLCRHVLGGLGDAYCSGFGSRQTKAADSPDSLDSLMRSRDVLAARAMQILGQAVEAALCGVEV